MPTWSFEHAVTGRATVQQVWTVWRDVENWPAWDPAVEWTKLDGPIEVGGSYTLKPKAGPRVTARFVRCEPLRGFAAETRLPYCRLIFDHDVREIPSGVRVTHRAPMHGWGTLIFRKLIGKNIARDMPAAMERLIARAEAAL